MTVAPATCPTSFTRAGMSYKSSIMPTTTMMRAAHNTALKSGVMGGNPRFNAGNWLATSKAAMTPVNIATPPNRGRGCLWTSRARGIAILPVRTMTDRMHPVVRNVTMQPVQRTRMSSRMGTPVPPTADCAQTIMMFLYPAFPGLTAHVRPFSPRTISDAE